MKISKLVTCALLGACGALAQSMPADYDGVLKTLGKQGDFKDGVLKINIPRSDLKVTIYGIATPTPFGFGGWLAMTKGNAGMDVMMGDLVLQEDEVNPVMSALLDNGLEVTAVHNHFFFESPRIFYMHVHGHGMAARPPSDRGLGVPEYHVEESGPDHQKTFRASVRIGGRTYGEGEGHSKKEAEQQAAEAAWTSITKRQSAGSPAGDGDAPDGDADGDGLQQRS